MRGLTFFEMDDVLLTMGDLAAVSHRLAVGLADLNAGVYAVAGQDFL